MSDSKVIINALNKVLLKNDFKKKASNWYWENNDVFLMVNLQKSQYGMQYYVNCGVFVKALGDVKYPKEEQCHIRFRLTSSDISDCPQISILLDLENQKISDADREIEITKIVQNSALPLLNKCISIVGIAQIISDEKSKHWAIRKNLRDWITQGGSALRLG